MYKNSPKLLIVAQNASTRFGGEAFLPLKYFQILKKLNYPVKMIAHGRNKKELTVLLEPYKDDIYYVKDTIFHQKMWKLGRKSPKLVQDYIIGNILSITDELIQRKRIKELVKKGEVDVIHQPIPVSPRAPSAIFGFKVPVIIGPLNGGMSFPPGYNEYQGSTASFSIFLLRKASYLINILVPGKRLAKIILVANERTAASLPMKPNNIKTLSENGVDSSIWKNRRLKSKSKKDEFHLTFIGRLIPLKGLNITLRALHLARHRGINVFLHVIGDGPERENIEEYAKRLGIFDFVRFYGFLSQEKCAGVINGFDALILNSLRECGGAVVLEAMSLGLPTIVSDWGGPADYVDANSGILVSPVPKNSFDSRLADAIEKLANNPKLCTKMGLAGIQKIEDEYDWDQKVLKLIGTYKDAVK